MLLLGKIRSLEYRVNGKMANRLSAMIIVGKYSFNGGKEFNKYRGGKKDDRKR